VRVIILEKLRIIKDDLKKIYESKNENSPQRKSAIIKDLENKKHEIMKQQCEIESEKEYVQRKLSNFKITLKNSSNDINESPNYNKDLLKEEDNIKEDNIEEQQSKIESDSKYVIDGINSDYEDNKKTRDEGSDRGSITSMSDISDNESMSSLRVSKSNNNLSVKELQDLKSIDSVENNENQKKSNVFVSKIDQKVLYKEFIKLLLKVKFEDLPSKHPGQNVSQNELWKEIIRRNIPKSEWLGFIGYELNNNFKKIFKNEKEF